MSSVGGCPSSFIRPDPEAPLREISAMTVACRPASSRISWPWLPELLAVDDALPGPRQAILGGTQRAPRKCHSAPS